MNKITINASKVYDVYIENGLLDNTNEYISLIENVKSILIITDDIVKELYLNKLLNNLEDKYNTFVFSFTPGEKSKSINTLKEIEKCLIENNFSRNDLIISLGGGVVSDISGFAASIYKRGIRYVNIATTLLSMVDASIGGKTAINTEYAKNLIGTFYQPSLVLIDPNAIDTQNKENILEGIGEIVKYACISDPTILKYIKTDIKSIIYPCLQIKAKLIELDEYDYNERTILNFGHSIAHAVEKLSNYKIPHGIAVLIGTLKMISALENTNAIEKGNVEKILTSINTEIPKQNFTNEEIIQQIKYDKKTESTTIKEILLNKFGQAKIETMAIEDLKELLDKSDY